MTTQPNYIAKNWTNLFSQQKTASASPTSERDSSGQIHHRQHRYVPHTNDSPSPATHPRARISPPITKKQIITPTQLPPRLSTNRSVFELKALLCRKTRSNDRHIPRPRKVFAQCNGLGNPCTGKEPCHWANEKYSN